MNYYYKNLYTYHVYVQTSQEEWYTRENEQIVRVGMSEWEESQLRMIDEDEARELDPDLMKVF